MHKLFGTVVLLYGWNILFAAEGKWTPQQVVELEPAWLKEQGLQIQPSKLWDPQRGTGLLAATVQVGSCSAGLISPNGLFITNHHCLFSILQQHSTPQKDFITDGFVAQNRGGELPGKALRAAIARKFTNVTTDILTSIPRGASDLQRKQAIEAKQNELLARCEERPSTRCKVASYDGGLFYTLIESTEFPDVRLVYAPPRAVGEFGGEIDNWSWPRHTGDVSIGRIYTAPDGSAAPFDSRNVPLKSEFFYPIAKGDLSAGDFVMVMGYPGITYRSLIAAEMEERRDRYFPGREALFGEWIRILEETTKGNQGGEIIVADTLKTLLNRYKNAQGQLAGFKRGHILEKQQAADATVLKWIGSQPGRTAAGDAYRSLVRMIADQRATWDHDFLLGQLPGGDELERAPVGPKLLSLGTLIARASQERQKSNAQRSSGFMERNLPRLRDRIEREQNSFYAPVDKKILLSFVQRALALPASQRMKSIDRAFAGLKGDDAIDRAIDGMYSRTRLGDLAERLKMFEETPGQLRARKDPLLDLAIEVGAEIDALDTKKREWEGKTSYLRPEWRRAVIAQAGRPVAPDGNSTLRVSFGEVKGYSPQEAVTMQPQTTLSGLVAKHRDQEPFDVPDAVLKAAAGRKSGAWKDAQLDDVPVAFLSDLDTTGGNSGSPVVNGKGELVGVNFDRVWENVANDFAYNPEIARNISVDVRYLLWLLDQVEGATGLLKELGL